MTSVPLGEARDRLSEFVAEVERTNERVTITRHGHPAAVLISADDLASIEQTLEILGHPGRDRGDPGGSGRRGRDPLCRQRRDQGPPRGPVIGPYAIRITARADRDLQRLPEKIAGACVEFIFGAL